ncbi:hypothetical protein GCM10009828_021830 [Actinoplanes couchii]|uniref:Uncharacterized protein n=1 Tax=Actinoplanes couchii TaxID=403638 RepID=A0ABQ3X115_9ACTN|nr:hypothetical protein Aco03nite_005610 [Actinoplanes couchii]
MAGSAAVEDAGSAGCGGGDTGWAAVGESAVMSQRLGQGYDENRGVGAAAGGP